MIPTELTVPPSHRLLPFVVRNWSRLLTVAGMLAVSDGVLFHDVIVSEFNKVWCESYCGPRAVPDDQRTYDVRYFHPAPPTVTPPTTSADTSEMADAEDVLGISVGNEHRAYRLATLSGDRKHVVNDVVAGVPVTVTYCDLADCARAYTATYRKRPLPISQLGYRAPRFVIAVDGVSYYQDTREPVDPANTPSPFPFAAYPVERMTWKEWKTRHPGTDAYEHASE